MSTRLAFLGSLDHFEAGSPELQRLVTTTIKSQADALLLTGNVGQPVDELRHVLEAFTAFPGVRGIVTGNRDLWQMEEDQRSSRQLWEETFPGLFHRYDYVWLEQRNIVLDRVAVCGTMAWYDYSARDVSLGYSVRQYENLKGLTNQDARYITWDFSDIDFSSFVLDQFIKRLDALEYDRTVDRIVAVTHYPAFLNDVSAQFDKRMRFDLAYQYNLAVGRALMPKNKLSAVVSGHQAASTHEQLQFGNNRVDAYVLGEATLDSQPLIIEVL